MGRKVVTKRAGACLHYALCKMKPFRCPTVWDMTTQRCVLRVYDGLTFVDLVAGDLIHAASNERFCVSFAHGSVSGSARF